MKVATQLLQSQEMRIKSAPAYVVTSRTRHHSLSEAGEQRPHEHYAAPQFAASEQELIALQVGGVH